MAVVIDVLRATSTIAQALAGGYRRVHCAEDLAVARALRAPGRVLAGEQDCVAPPDFDLGNSPAGVLEPRASELVLCTTNGTPTVVAAAGHAPLVLLASVLNLDALLEALAREAASASASVLLVCSGSEGAESLEDLYLAGRIAARLHGERGAAASAAERLAARFQTPLDALLASPHAASLRAAGLEHDVHWCARESALAVVPRVIEVSERVAIVAAQ